jgi:hypothetical protein
MSIINEMSAYALAVEDSLVSPEVFQIVSEHLAQDYKISQAKASAILIASWSFCNVSDESFKDFLKHWVEDQCGESVDD